MAQAQWQEMFTGLHSTGVLAAQLNVYIVTVTSGLGISVASGKAVIQGFLARSDAAVALTCAAADPTNPRIDRAVLHADLSAHTLSVILLTGTPGVSPTPPALTQTTTVWEISLYQVRVNATQTTLTAGSLTDERGYSTPTGAPGVVAQALDTHVSATGDQVILTYAPAATGLYRVSGGFTFANGTTPEAVTFRTTYGDAHGGGTVTTYFQTTESPSRALNAVSIVSSPFAAGVQSVTFWAVLGTNIIVHWNDAGGTPNDFVTAVIERLA